MPRALPLAALAFAVSAGALAAAPIYVSPAMTFETETRQSAWGPGAASRVEDAIFVGPAWNASQSFGDIFGGVSTTSLPNPARLAWDACQLIPWIIRPDCGSRPAANLSLRLDTRTGAEATISTSGRVGLELGYLLDAGSLGARLDYAAEVLAPDAPPTRGQAFSLPTTATLAGGGLDSQSPTAQAKVDVVADLFLAAAVQGCLIGAGCTEAGGTILDEKVRLELISIDPLAVTYLDGFTPDFLTLETPLLDYTYSVEADLITKKIAGTSQRRSTGERETTEGGGDGLPSSGLNIELAAFDIQAPQLDQAVALKPGETELKLSGQSPFIGVSADLDGLLAYANVLPPLGLRVDLANILSASIDLIDAKAGPRVEVFQDFLLTPTLMVELAFDREVQLRDAAALADWNAAFDWSGPWDALPEFILTDDTTFTPTFWVDALVKAETGLQFGAGFDLTLLEGSLNLSLGPFNFDAVLGPFDEVTLPYRPDFARVSLFDDSFTLGGLNLFEGDPFLISFGGFGPVTPRQDAAIPLPAAAPLLAAALGLLVATGRRRRRAAGVTP